MPSQGVFANISPDSGSIRVLYKTINGQDYIKALTVSNKDENGDDIALSLNELQTINIPLTGSGGAVALDAISINEKSGYFFIDVQDKVVNTISGSLNANVALTPYLTETFFYNNYNALISNAELSKTSNIRFDVDRTGGNVKPKNFNAIAGFGEMIFSMNYEDIDGNLIPFVQESDYNTTTQNTKGALTSSVESFINNRDLYLRVLEPDLEEALSFPQVSLLDVQLTKDNTTITNVLYNLQAESTLKIQVDDNENFTNANGHRTTQVIARQVFDAGELNYEYTPFTEYIASGSFNSGEIFVRVKQETVITGFNSTVPKRTINIRPFLSSDTNSSVDFLRVTQYFTDQIPYALPAPVQDSNYSDTGLVNSRYNGTKTTSADYGGIDPAISATTFDAKEYRKDENTDFICSQSLAERGELEKYLFVGSGDLPVLKSTSVGTITGASTMTTSIGSGQNVITSTTDTSFIVRGLPDILNTLQVGELITLSSGSNTETVQITAILPTINSISNLFQLSSKELQVSRGALGTTPQASFAEGTIVARFNGTRLFKFDKSRTISVNDKLLWVKENRTVITTDDKGFVISTLTCNV